MEDDCNQNFVNGTQSGSFVCFTLYMQVFENCWSKQKVLPTARDRIPDQKPANQVAWFQWISGSSNTITINNDLKRNSFQDDQLYQSLVLHMVYLPLDSPILANYMKITISALSLANIVQYHFRCAELIHILIRLTASPPANLSLHSPFSVKIQESLQPYLDQLNGDCLWWTTESTSLNLLIT